MIFRGPVGSSQGSNSHKVLGEEFQIDKNIVMFHLAYFDHDLSNSIGKEKVERARELDSRTPGATQIGFWWSGAGMYNRSVQWLREQDPQDWDGPVVRDYFDEIETIFSGRVANIPMPYPPLKHVVLPQRFEGLI